MSTDTQGITTGVAGFASQLRSVSWFRNVGKPHPRDEAVVRIWKWEEWPGPEGGHSDWFGGYLVVVREHLERDQGSKEKELKATWQEIERLTVDLAIPCVPDYRADEDAWYGPTACVWQAAYTAALVACHVLVGQAPPDPIADQWMWLTEGHWPCDYAQAPPYRWDEDESLIDVPACKLLVY